MVTIEEIKAKMAKLEQEAEEIKLLKEDYHMAKRFRLLLVKTEFN